MLELAEQVLAGESLDPSWIYVPVGSACTVSGMVVGTVLTQRPGLPALFRPNFRIVGCNVHPVLVALDRLLGFHVWSGFGCMPTTITLTVREACCALVELGGQI